MRVGATDDEVIFSNCRRCYGLADKLIPRLEASSKTGLCYFVATSCQLLF